MSELVTLETILKNKEKIKNKNKSEGKISVPSLGGHIIVEMPDRALMADSQAINNPMESNAHLVYNCIKEPSLKDKKLQEEFGALTPKELLSVLLTDGEIANIAAKIMKLAGYTESGVELVDEIKN